MRESMFECDYLLYQARVQGAGLCGPRADFQGAVAFVMSDRRVLAFHEKGEGGGGCDGRDETGISGQTWLDRPFLLLYSLQCRQRTL